MKSKLTLTPEFRLLVETYQQANQIETLTGALYELIAIGYGREQEYDDELAWCATDAEETELFAEFDDDPNAPKHFALWFARRFAPKHGGKREGSGRKQVEGA